jgi:hypothetical protein
MFTLKNDGAGHDDPEGISSCCWCAPENFYWSEDGEKITREEAEEMFWKDQSWSEDQAYEYYFKESGLPVPSYEPHKNGPHP